MKNKVKIIWIIFLSVLIGTIPILSGCAQKDPAVIATEVAEEWTANNIDSVSKNIAEMVAGESFLLEKIVAKTIEAKINQRISWELSTPQKISEDRYEVVATASTPIDMAIMGTYKASIEYILTIDTGEKQVLDTDMDPGSFALTKQ